MFRNRKNLLIPDEVIKARAQNIDPARIILGPIGGILSPEHVTRRCARPRVSNDTKITHIIWQGRRDVPIALVKRSAQRYRSIEFQRPSHRLATILGNVDKVVRFLTTVNPDFL